jgi:hypothetical protein
VITFLSGEETRDKPAAPPILFLDLAVLVAGSSSGTSRAAPSSFERCCWSSSRTLRMYCGTSRVSGGEKRAESGKQTSAVLAGASTRSLALTSRASNKSFWYFNTRW